MMYKSAEDIKKIILGNFFKACDDSRMTDYMIAKKTGEKYKVIYAYRYDEKVIGYDKIFQWCVDCDIDHDFVFTPSNNGKEYNVFNTSD